MSADLPAVTIVIAAFNATEFLDGCFGSLLQQTEPGWEAIVVDDHSMDGTADAVRAWSARDGRVRLAQTPRNSGPSAARNVGMDAARGRWIAILDADDRYAPERLATMLARAEAAGADIVSDNPLIVTERDPAGEPMFTGELMERAHRVDMAELVLGNIGTRDKPRVAYGFMKPLLRAAFLREHGLRYREDMRFSEDFVFYTQCLERGAHWEYVPARTYLYTVREDSLSSSAKPVGLDQLVHLYEFSLALPNVPAVRRDGAARRAAVLHWHKVRRWYTYRALVEAAKGRRFGAAAALLLRRPDAIGGVLAEAAVQAPALARKAAGRLGLQQGRQRS